MSSSFSQLSFLSNESREKNWFDATLDALNVCQSPGWPDAFGMNLKQWLQRQAIRRIPTLSLFSGGGGLDMAFHDAGFDIRQMVEIDHRFAATLAKNVENGGLLSGGEVICADIRDYDPPSDLEVDFIIGGPPCQTFSAAGRRASGVKGTSDPRGKLFEDYVRILSKLRPKGFLFENVYGIIGAEGGDAWKAIQAAFRAAGYDIHSRILDAADFGVPQHRERLFVVGHRIDDGDTHFLFPRPTHGPDASPPSPFYAAGKAVQGAEPQNEAGLALGGRWKELLPGIPPGLNYSYYTAEMGHPRPIFAWRSKFSDFLYKADPNVPVRTIKAQGGAFTGPFSWQNRHFSAEEMKRLQTFPDAYEIAGNRGTQLHQIGNSVPPQLGRILAMAVLDQLFGIGLPVAPDYLQESEMLGFRKRKRALSERYKLAATAAIASLPHAGTPTVAAYESVGADQISLGPQFALFCPPEIGQPFYNGQYQVSAKNLSIGLQFDDCNEVGLKMKINPSRSGWNIPVENIDIEASCRDLRDVTIAWKYLELVIRRVFGIDDLVQLNGYFQYDPKMKVELLQCGLADQDAAHVLAIVHGGQGVASQRKLLDFACDWDMTEAQALSALHKLRAMGYEVRSHSTNAQIPQGEYLIPYKFPTLTPKSVQLFKKL